MSFPSCDHEPICMWEFTGTICSSPVLPSALTQESWCREFDAYATRFPSGDHAGTSSSPGANETRLKVPRAMLRSEEHTSELQSPCNLVCRLLLEKKKKRIKDVLLACI